MSRYRKKPVEIEAKQFNGLDDYLNIVEWMKENNDTNALADEVEYRTPIMLIPTREGWMAASPGDYIIKEPFPSGGRWFYPCKPDVFEQTYEAII